MPSTATDKTTELPRNQLGEAVQKGSRLVGVVGDIDNQSLSSNYPKHVFWVPRNSMAGLMLATYQVKRWGLLVNGSLVCLIWSGITASSLLQTSTHRQLIMREAISTLSRVRSHVEEIRLEPSPAAPPPYEMPTKKPGSLGIMQGM